MSCLSYSGKIGDPRAPVFPVAHYYRSHEGLTLTNPSRVQFAAWAGLSSSDEFFTSRDAQTAFQDHLEFLATRVNNITGVRYMCGDRAGGNWQSFARKRHGKSPVCKMNTSGLHPNLSQG